MKILKIVELFMYKIIRGMLRFIISLTYKINEFMFINDKQSSYKDLIKNKQYAKYKHSLYPTERDIEQVATTLTEGDITTNTNYSGIQQLGDYLSPVGNDKPHTVTIMQRNGRSSHIIAEFEVTNAIYSEWIIACCNTMWKTKHKIFTDIHGNTYPVGQLLECTASIKY